MIGQWEDVTEPNKNERTFVDDEVCVVSMSDLDELFEEARRRMLVPALGKNRLDDDLRTNRRRLV
jgi:hypothetical protein